MGSITKLPARDERRAIEGGAERLLQRERDTRAVHHIFRDMVRTRETTHENYAVFLTKQARHDLAKLDRHQKEVALEKMKRIAERPSEIGDEKFGKFRGFKSLKMDGTSHVILFTYDERDMRVTIVGYGHHDVVYRSVPNLDGELVTLEQWTGPVH